MGYNYDFDIAALAIYIVILLHYVRGKHIKNKLNIVFFTLVCVSMLTPICDMFGAMVIDEQMPVPVVMAVNMLYYLSEPVTTFLFVVYIMFQLEMKQKMSIWKKSILYIPIVILAFVILLNPWFGTIFRYTVAGGYSRGSFHMLSYLTKIFYYLLVAIYAELNRRDLNYEIRKTVYFIVTMNIVAMAIQYFSKVILIRGFAFSISMFVLLVNIQRKEHSSIDANGMGNKKYLAERCSKLMYNKVAFGSILITITDYDLISHSYGVDNAESLMKQIGEELQEYVGVGNAYKISSNCFAINHSLDCDLDEVMQNLYTSIKKPKLINDVEINHACLMTCLMFPETIKNMEEYFTYVSSFQQYNHNQDGIIQASSLSVRDRVREKEVRRAIKRGLTEGHFEVYYQPICTSNDQKFVTAEALVRLRDTKLGSVPPGEFIPLAEEDGSIIEIGDYVLEEVCKFIEKYDLNELGLEYIEVNLSTVQCLQQDFIDKIKEIVDRYKVDASKICFEITETASNYSPVIFTENLNKLVELGFELALDDFGTGYSNLLRMVTSSFGIIKFDKEMTERSCGEERLKDMFEKLQNVFHSMDARVVAEGVETEEQLSFLKEAGCDYIQGYLFSKPVPEKEFILFLENRRKTLA